MSEFYAGHWAFGAGVIYDARRYLAGGFIPGHGHVVRVAEFLQAHDKLCDQGDDCYYRVAERTEAERGAEPSEERSRP